MTEVIPFRDDVQILSDVVAADGRVSWRPAATGAGEPYNEYLIAGEGRLLLVDTGVALHERGIVECLARSLQGRSLIVYITRIELDCIGNLGAILDAFPQAQVVTANPISPVDLVHRAGRGTIPVTHMGFSQSLASFGFPSITVLEPAVRTLGTSWLHDSKSGLLFSSDCFCAEALAPGAPPVRASGEGMPTVDALRQALRAKFDWLARAEPGSLLCRLDEIRSRYSLAGIAPIHGRPVDGLQATASTLEAYKEAIGGR
jgi:flavorubredoxin